MSSYHAWAINPRTGQIEKCAYMDDYFGRHRYGVCFLDDKDELVYPAAEIEGVDPPLKGIDP